MHEVFSNRTEGTLTRTMENRVRVQKMCDKAPRRLQQWLLGTCRAPSPSLGLVQQKSMTKNCNVHEFFRTVYSESSTSSIYIYIISLYIYIRTVYSGAERILFRTCHFLDILSGALTNQVDFPCVGIDPQDAIGTPEWH